MMDSEIEKKAKTYKRIMYTSVVFSIIITLVFGVNIYQLQVSVKKTVDSKLNDIRGNLSEILLKSSSGDLTEAVQIVNSQFKADIDALSVSLAETKESVEALNALFPEGTLMAFNRSKCPGGWKKFNEASGRFIVASGTGRNLPMLKPGDVGGEASHTLSIESMPVHEHEFEEDGFYNKSTLNGEGLNLEFRDSNSLGVTRKSGITRQVGKGQPHNNMPPYYVVSLCTKL